MEECIMKHTWGNILNLGDILGQEIWQLRDSWHYNLGIEKIFLEVRASNTPARNLYIQNGYNEISIRKKYYSDNEDAIVMAKEI